jgi:glycosyltransferase involved in cell wall biosynthesis
VNFSIIIPTYNRCESLGRALKSLAQLDSPSGEFEVLVVDNGSADQTREVFEVARTASPERNWRYFYEPIPGLLSGRHRGALEAQGDICVFIGDDVCVSRGWLNALGEAFRDPEVVLAGGPSLPTFESAPPDWLSGFYSESERGHFCPWLSLWDGGGSVREIDPCCVWGLNFAIRKSALFEAGGFNPDCIPKRLQRFQGDGETGLSLKVRKAGLKALYHPGASLAHEVPVSRLTVEYFEQRAYYQGVCDSYTCIRSNRAVLADKLSWKDPLRWVKRLLTMPVPASGSELGELMRRTTRAYEKGYKFHREEVRRDPKLLAWVLREDYWDYRLPEGWERLWRITSSDL